MSEKILVTGGTGYIGSHTVVELTEQGYDVVIADSLANSDISVVDRIAEICKKKPTFEQLDLCDENATLDFFSRHQIKAVIHFAAYKAVGESVQKPLMYYRNNLYSLINLLGAMRKYDVCNIVFSSSCTVYGQPDILPVIETSPKKKAESPYGNTKQISEDILFDVSKEDNTQVIALRYFNPVGAHPSALIGELPIGVPNNLVPYITQTAIGKREALNVFGNDYNTPDGTAIRDYIHVVDLAKAHVFALQRLLNKKNKSAFEAFNIGTGNGSSVMQVIKAFENATGMKLNYKMVPRRPGDVEKIFADISLAHQELGWKTLFSLEDAMLHQWQWEQRINATK
jgi:UDP-glucose 4-epimerase